MKKAVALLVCIIVSAGLVACGSSDDSSTDTSAAETTTSESNGGEAGNKESTAGGATLTIAAADSGLAYSSDSATTKAGKVTVEFDNPQPLDHDVAFEDESGETIGKTEIITEGSDSTVVEFEPGTYTFYCTVPGHREGGMEGTLTVE